MATDADRISELIDALRTRIADLEYKIAGLKQHNQELRETIKALMEPPDVPRSSSVSKRGT